MWHKHKLYLNGQTAGTNTNRDVSSICNHQSRWLLLPRPVLRNILSSNSIFTDFPPRFSCRNPHTAVAAKDIRPVHSLPRRNTSQIQDQHQTLAKGIHLNAQRVLRQIESQRCILRHGTHSTQSERQPHGHCKYLILCEFSRAIRRTRFPRKPVRTLGHACKEIY